MTIVIQTKKKASNNAKKAKKTGEQNEIDIFVRLG